MTDASTTREQRLEAARRIARVNKGLLEARLSPSNRMSVEEARAQTQKTLEAQRKRVLRTRPRRTKGNPKN